jgi:hypothetical protein
VLEAVWSSAFDPSTGTHGTALVHGVVNNQIHSVFRIMSERIYIWLKTIDVSRHVTMFPTRLKRNVSQRQMQLP